MCSAPFFSYFLHSFHSSHSLALMLWYPLIKNCLLYFIYKFANSSSHCQSLFYSTQSLWVYCCVWSNTLNNYCYYAYSPLISFVLLFHLYLFNIKKLSCKVVGQIKFQQQLISSKFNSSTSTSHKSRPLVIFASLFDDNNNKRERQQQQISHSHINLRKVEVKRVKIVKRSFVIFVVWKVSLQLLKIVSHYTQLY